MLRDRPGDYRIDEPAISCRWYCSSVVTGFWLLNCFSIESYQPPSQNKCTDFKDIYLTLGLERFEAISLQLPKTIFPCQLLSHIKLMRLISIPSTHSNNVPEAPWSPHIILCLIVWILIEDSVQFLVLSPKREAQSRGDNRHQQTERSGNPGAFRVKWLFIGGEDIRAQQRTTLTQGSVTG